jgi:Gpi18-like mannosyltransferase
MFALYDLTRDELEESGGIRTAFYMLIFPSAFFLAQVYTEGLFAGLAFGCLALLHRKRLVWAALLAALATWTRAVGIALIMPLAITWAQEVGLGGLSMEAISWRKLARGLLVLSPLAAYLIWRHFLGTQFGLIEDNWFGRSVFDMERFIYGWQVALDSIFQNENPQTQIYFILELLSVVVAFAACLLTLRRYPGLTLFGLAALVIPFTSGAPQSLIRYILAVPSLFIVLGRLGKHPAFDRAWTLASVLLLGMQAMLFTFDMWVA